jgi:ComF family protein
MRLGIYDGRLRDAILRMKNLAGEGVADLLGRVAAEAREVAIREHGITTIVPIPLHWRRKWSRGFNQAASLAREMGTALGLPVLHRVLRRVKPTSQHLQPSATARRENMKGAFRAKTNANLARQNILLVDDVMTTGSTAGEAARMLKQAGAAKVVAIVLARR